MCVRTRAHRHYCLLLIVRLASNRSFDILNFTKNTLLCVIIFIDIGSMGEIRRRSTIRARRVFIPIRIDFHIKVWLTDLKRRRHRYLELWHLRNSRSCDLLLINWVHARNLGQSVVSCIFVIHVYFVR